MPASAARPPWLLASIVACALFMENLDSTIIVTAVPAMAASFGVAPADLSVGVTAYMLTLAVFIPISAWVADRYGTRSVLAAAIAVFVGASALCAACSGLPAFVLARVLQGVGGAMMVPVGRMIVVRTTPKAELMAAMAAITWPSLVAPVIGPSLGGFIVTYLQWRWIFYINLPIGLAGLLLVGRYVPNLLAERARPFDLPGFALTAAAVMALMYGLGLLSRGDPHGLRMAVLLLGMLALRHMRRAAHPLVDLYPFRLATFHDTLVGGMFSRLAISAGLFVLPLMFQVGFGMSAFAAGMLMLVGAVGSLGTKAVAIAIVRRLGFRAVLVGNSLLIGLSTLACVSLSPGQPVPAMVLVMLSCGFTRSLQFTCLNTLGYADMPAERVGAASMLSSMAQQLAMALGVTGAALLLRLSTWLRGGQAGHPLPGDFHAALVALALVAVLAVVWFSRLQSEAGMQIRGRRA
jgi:EmrB/QacA subfamily drug resistance transporter